MFEVPWHHEEAKNSGDVRLPASMAPVLPRLSGKKHISDMKKTRTKNCEVPAPPAPPSAMGLRQTQWLRKVHSICLARGSITQTVAKNRHINIDVNSSYKNTPVAIFCLHGTVVRRSFKPGAVMITLGWCEPPPKICHVLRHKSGASSGLPSFWKLSFAANKYNDYSASAPRGPFTLPRRCCFDVRVR